MKRLLKKKAIVSVLIAITLLGSTQAYAATALNTNIISLIKDGFRSITAYFMQITDQEAAIIEANSTQDLEQYIDTAAKQTINDIETYKNSEIARADKEIDTYTDDLKKQLDTVVTDEKNKTKQQITDKIDSDVKNIKSELDKDMEKYIKDLLKKK
jgi:uncharacterized protein YicC (UPF0701 family)